MEKNCSIVSCVDIASRGKGRDAKEISATCDFMRRDFFIVNEPQRSITSLSGRYRHKMASLATVRVSEAERLL